MNLVAAIFSRRVRGFRVIEVAALTVLVVLVFCVYLMKAQAAGERAQIAGIDREIAREQRAVRELKAAAAQLEQPERIERLTEAYLDLEPVAAKREATPDAIARMGGEPSQVAP